MMQTQGDTSYMEMIQTQGDIASESHVGEHFDPEIQTEHDDRILLLLHRGGVYIPKGTHPKQS